MREKLGVAGFVLLLVAVWGVGFLWVRGDLHFGDDKASAAKAKPSAQPSAQPSALPSASASAVPTPPGDGVYTGQIGLAQERKPVDVNPVRPRPRPVALPPVAQFNMASFNILGSSHTNKGGHHSWLASGPQRLGGAISILDSHQVTVAGFQEFQPDQRRAFAGREGWAMYPGLTMGGGAGENSVVWRTDTWDLVKPATIPIPYFNGRARPMPYVLLRHKATGVQAYFSTFHNPANTRQFRNQARFRSEATSRQINLFNELEKSGIPQFVTGDMNEREEYFCRVTGSTPLIAAAGGSNDGRCVPPRPTQIDWIFGSPAVQFGGYRIDKSALVRRTTDHPVVVTGVVIDALKFKNAYAPTLLPPS